VPGPGCHGDVDVTSLDATVGASAKLRRSRSGQLSAQRGFLPGWQPRVSPDKLSLPGARLDPGPGAFEPKLTASGKEWDLAELNGAETMPMAAFTSTSAARSTPQQWAAPVGVWFCLPAGDRSRSRKPRPLKKGALAAARDPTWELSKLRERVLELEAQVLQKAAAAPEERGGGVGAHAKGTRMVAAKVR
jgi:hypothetical protein